MYVNDEKKLIVVVIFVLAFFMTACGYNNKITCTKDNGKGLVTKFDIEFNGDDKLVLTADLLESAFEKRFDIKSGATKEDTKKSFEDKDFKCE